MDCLAADAGSFASDGAGATVVSGATMQTTCATGTYSSTGAGSCTAVGCGLVVVFANTAFIRIYIYISSWRLV